MIEEERAEPDAGQTPEAGTSAAEQPLAPRTCVADLWRRAKKDESHDSKADPLSRRSDRRLLARRIHLFRESDKLANGHILAELADDSYECCYRGRRDQRLVVLSSQYLETIQERA